MSDYHPQTLDTKWQERWQRDRAFEVAVDPSRPKYYCLEMFAYPSGHAHVGHVRNYIIGDVMARTKRMRGYNVLHPFGWDAFGLPAENAAIKSGIHPEASTRANIAHMKGQLQRLGISYAWERELATCDAEYYKWNQWLFIRMFEKGLAYRRKSSVNWCPVDQTVLANEQVVDGGCWRCGTRGRNARSGAVVLPHHGVRRRTARRHRGSGEVARKGPHDAAQLDRALGGGPGHVRARRGRRRRRSRCSPPASTRSTAPPSCCSAPSTRWCRRWPTGPATPTALRKQVQTFRLQDRTARISGELEKQGFDTGFTAINPFTQEPVPVWVANFVLGDYGTGAIMAVPAHDERDFEFATKYGLPIRRVVSALPGERGDAQEPPLPDAGVRHQRRLRRVQRPPHRGGAEADDRRREGARHRRGHRAVPAEGLGHLAAALLGHAHPDGGVSRRTASCRCRTISCRSSCRRSRSSPGAAIRRWRRCPSS